MKRLHRVRLINWHYFEDETLTFRGSALLAGDNGSGKSTLLDAIQYVLVADTRRVKFNSSAHGESKRDLKGYLRGKLGTEEGVADEADAEVTYLRNDDFTTYVVLEFLDTRKATSFLVGVAIDSYREGEHDTPQFFKIEDARLEDLDFHSGPTVANVREFRTRLRLMPSATVYTAVERYQRELLHKLGFLPGRFFKLLVKAMGFQPITKIREFVCEYLLDAEPVNIDAMRDNLQNYRQFEAMLRQTKEKIARLEAVEQAFEEKEAWVERIRVQDYIIRRARLEEHTAAQAETEALIGELTAQKKHAETAHRALIERRSQLDADIARLAAAIQTSSAQQIIDRLTRELEDRQRERDRQKLDFEALRKGCREEAEAIEWVLSRLGGLNDGSSDAIEVLRAQLEDARARFASAALVEAQALLIETWLSERAKTIAALREIVDERRHRLQGAIRRLDDECAELGRELADLQRKKRTYSPSVTQLRQRIEAEVTLGGKPVEAMVLCELLEIRDPRWQNAVEGYLNTQRFDLLVPPEAFDQSLAVYERRKREYRLHSVGLIDGERVLRHQHNFARGSLAEEVETDNSYARAYVNRLLGHVMKCETEQELKQHRVAITPTCMTYRNYVARQIDPSVYEVPYIGERAIARQIEQKTVRLNAARDELDEARRGLDLTTELGRRLGDREHLYARLLDLQTSALGLPETLRAIADLERQIAEVDRAEIVELQARRDWAQRDRAKVQADIDQAQAESQRCGFEIEELERKRGALEQAVSESAESVREFEVTHPAAAAGGRERYADETRTKSPAQIRANFEANREGNRTRLENLRADLLKLRLAYNNTYQFGGAADAEDNDSYSAELRKLRESELPEYEERIARARDAAEQEFKEHFVSKLKEQLEKAQMEFANLNRVLRSIEFGQDRYEFVARPARAYQRFYDMITDEMLLEGGQSLFSYAFQSRHKATIDELFEEILGVEEGKQAERIATYTDYRTYMDFDIVIHHKNGEKSRFGRVAREKSGGEMQTPYYVAIVASFLQAYGGANRDDAIGLMLFDEAFNRMDADRIEKTLGFINRLGLQVIVAAPTEKVEVITPHVADTVIVFRDGHRVWTTPWENVERQTVGDVGVSGEERTPATRVVTTGAADEVAAGSEAP